MKPNQYNGWTEWKVKFRPLANHFSKDPNQHSFQPNGDEEKYVKNYDPKFVWTHIHGETSDSVKAGYLSSSDTFSYFITELPWESQGDYALVALEVTCDCSQVDGSEVEGDPDCDACGGNGFLTKVLD